MGDFVETTLERLGTVFLYNINPSSEVLDSWFHGLESDAEALLRLLQFSCAKLRDGHPFPEGFNLLAL
jgi:hypothetical protein